MALLASNFTTPIGTLNLISDGSLLLAANLSNMNAAKASLHSDYADFKIEQVKKLPVITVLL